MYFVILVNRRYITCVPSPDNPSLAKQKHIANETLSFFIQLAKNLWLISIAEELEKLSLEVLGE